MTEIVLEGCNTPIIGESDFLDSFLSKFSEAKRKELGEIHQCIWENEDFVNNCGECQDSFEFFSSKHHCRCCGGVFCKKCCQDVFSYRVCDGCRRGESAGIHLKEVILKNLPPSKEFHPQKYVKLAYGSKIDDAGNSGYFEFSNDSENEICCVKLLSPEKHHVVYACPRPGYISVPYQHKVHYNFEGNNWEYVHVLVLHDNPHPLPSDLKVVFDTKTFDSQEHIVRNISPCAAVSNFHHAAAYSVPSIKQNVILSYKGNGVVEISQPKFLTARNSKALQSNTTSIKLIFSSKG